MASIVQAGARWRAQVRREGKSIAKTFRTKAQAMAWGREMGTAIDDGRDIDKMSAPPIYRQRTLHIRCRPGY